MAEALISKGAERRQATVRTSMKAGGLEHWIYSSPCQDYLNEKCNSNGVEVRAKPFTVPSNALCFLKWDNHEKRWEVFTFLAFMARHRRRKREFLLNPSLRPVSVFPPLPIFLSIVFLATA
jgi:hypothetical protein